MNRTESTSLPPSPASERASSPESVVVEAEEIWQEWRAQDHTAQYTLGITERQQLAAQCLEDAAVCHRAAEITTSNWQKRDLTEGARDLRLNALFLVPEEVTEEKIDNAISLSIDMVKERRQEGWDPDDFESYVKLYDLQHLIAFWEASLGKQEGAPERVEVAKAILGASIVESAEDIGRMLQTTAAMHPARGSSLAGRKGFLEGHNAEFLLLTATRLNLLFQGKVDELVLRSAISMEDGNNMADKALSVDMTVHAPHENAVRFIQCKSGKTGRGRQYAPHITKVLLDWQQVTDNTEFVLFMLQEFVESDNKYTQEDIIQELNRIMGLDKRVSGHDNPALDDLLVVN